MAEKIEITVTKDYVGGWGEYEGIREIIQNGIDGEQEYGCELKVSYTPNGKLAVENIGGSIPKEALLIDALKQYYSKVTQSFTEPFGKVISTTTCSLHGRARNSLCR